MYWCLYSSVPQPPGRTERLNKEYFTYRQSLKEVLFQVTWYANKNVSFSAMTAT